MIKQTPAKQKLLHILKKHNEMTIGELMESFSISEIAIRKHIHELEQQGFIEKRSHKKKIGRPYYTYQLTQKGHRIFPNQYERMPLEILKDIEDIQGSRAVSDLLMRRMLREKVNLELELEADETAEKMNEYAYFQNENGYMLEVERLGEGTYEIRNYNCPIANVATVYKEICGNEKSMLESIFSNTEIETNSLIIDGKHLCRWTITEKNQDN